MIRVIAERMIWWRGGGVIKMGNWCGWDGEWRRRMDLGVEGEGWGEVEVRW